MNTSEKARKDFRTFLWLVWNHLGLPEPTPVQYDMGLFMSDPNLSRKLLMAFRGVGKSYVCSAYVLWRLYGNPNLNILVVSASKDRSDAFARFTKMLIHDMPLLRDMKPRHGHGFDSVEKFTVGNAVVSQSPSVKSVGLYGQITGTRADIIVSDDCEVPNNSETITQQDKLAERVKEFAAILKPDEPNEPQREIIYLGTPQTESSLYTKLPERGYVSRIWPARVPQPKDVDKYEGKLAPLVYERIDTKAPGTPIDTRFDHEELNEREAEYGRSGFSLQYQLDTSLSDADRYPLKCRDFIVMDIDNDVAPEKIVWTSDKEKALNIPMLGLVGDRWYGRVPLPDEAFLPYQGSVMAIDPSGRGADETGYVVVKMLNGQLFLSACGGFKGGYDKKTLAKLANIAKEQKVNLILIEPNFGDGMFNELFKPVCHAIYKVTIEDAPRASTMKEGRIIDVLEPILNQHRLIIDKSLIVKDAKETDESDPHYIHRRLVHQLTRLTRQRGALKHDDRIDPLAMACAYWVDQIGVNVEEAASDRRGEEIENLLHDFMGSVFGREEPLHRTWLDQSGIRSS
tara:strand:+ start:21206 stop:22915 length:1710 start_codon:yes stop_codon:yes gene_type:complete